MQTFRAAWDGFDLCLNAFQTETGLSLDLDPNFS